MELTTRETGLIRCLLYPVQFDDDPAESVDHVIRDVIQRKCLNAGSQEYSDAINHALNSQVKIANLVPGLSEEQAREYLLQVASRLAAGANTRLKEMWPCRPREETTSS